MKIKTLSKSWTFQIDDENWKVTYSFSSGYWHVSTNRLSQKTIKDDGKGINREKAIYLIAQVKAEIEQKLKEIL